MKKEYELPEENPDKHVVSDLNRPCLFTDEEKLRRIEEAIKEEEAGLYFTHEEIKSRFKDRT